MAFPGGTGEHRERSRAGPPGQGHCGEALAEQVAREVLVGDRDRPVGPLFTQVDEEGHQGRPDDLFEVESGQESIEMDVQALVVEGAHAGQHRGHRRVDISGAKG